MLNQSLTVIILTYNETLHIRRCIESVRHLTRNILVVDSYSTDDTVQVAEALGATVVQHSFVNHADQLNWALQHCDIKTDWIIRLDADEYLSNELSEELQTILPTLHLPVTGISLNYRHYFWGRWIRHGTRYPIPLLRIWRTGYGFAQNDLMDEKILLREGAIYKAQNDFIHEDLNNLSFFINKHNAYATREAIELLNRKYRFLPEKQNRQGLVSAKHFNRRMKDRLYCKSYMIWIRSFAYFVYRYIFRLGFLDGKEGLVYHFLQGFWFRFLADMKSLEIEKLAREKHISVSEAVQLYRR